MAVILRWLVSPGPAVYAVSAYIRCAVGVYPLDFE